MLSNMLYLVETKERSIIENKAIYYLKAD